MSDIDKVRSIFKQLFEAYPNNKATEGTVAIYFRLLQDIPADELQTVVDQAVTTLKYLPTVAELREIHHSLVEPVSQTAAEAWGDVLRQVRQVGYTGTPSFDNPYTAQVVRAIGWWEICTSDRPGVVRAHFMRMYDQLVARDDTLHKLTTDAKQLMDSSERSQPTQAKVDLKKLMIGEDE